MEIFDASDFAPRGACGHWTGSWVMVYMLANMAVFAAYFLIPTILIGAGSSKETPLLSRKERFIARVVFALFIFSCGMGHLLENIGAFYWPAYRFFALWHVLTAISSLWAVVVTYRLRKRIMMGL